MKDGTHMTPTTIGAQPTFHPTVPGALAGGQKQRPGLRYVPGFSQIIPAAIARAEQIWAGREKFGRLLMACGLFAVILPIEIGYESELFVSRRIFGIPPHYAITAVAFLAALATDLRYYSWLVTRPVVVFGLACLAYVLTIGVLRHGASSYMLRSDLYIIRWFFVGFILMRMSISSGLLRWYLGVAAVVVLVVMFTLDFQSSQGHQVDTSTKRAISWSLYPVSNCGTIMISLGMMSLWPRSRRWAVFFAVCFGLLFFAGAIRSSTRSLFVQQAFCLGLVLLALSRDNRMRGRGQQLRRVGVGFALIGAAAAVWQILAGGLLAGYTQLSGRFISQEGILNDGTLWARLMEGQELLRSLTVDEIILGTGLGGMFFTPLGYWTNTPHIAVLGWLQKGGVFVFMVVLLAVYIRPFLSLVSAMLRPDRRSAFPPPILVVGPSLMTWALLTFISGGLDNGSFLGLGGLTALWMQLSMDEKIMNPHLYSGRVPKSLDRTISGGNVLGAAAAG
jgi:hypothetical protein